jgi:hypothetical protein
MNTDYIVGIAKAGDCVKMLLDMDKVISTQDMMILNEAV